jgi:hypothetical protein
METEILSTSPADLCATFSEVMRRLVKAYTNDQWWASGTFHTADADGVADGGCEILILIRPPGVKPHSVEEATADLIARLPTKKVPAVAGAS